VISFLLLGCTLSDGSVDAVLDVRISDYVPLDEGGAWTYRDDANGDSEGLPDDDELVLAQVVEGGEIGLRRGSRWADAVPLGWMVWDVEDGLALEAFSYGELEGSQSHRFAQDSPLVNTEVTDGEWSCETERLATFETWYGEYEHILKITCNGSEVLGGNWFFAKNIGLIRVQGEAFDLDLVAPW